MSTSKHIDKICIAIVSIILAIAVLFMFGDKLGLSATDNSPKYESTIFDTSYVHSIDIVMDDWDAFIETCENEEYSYCTAIVDGNKYNNIAIRAKGNTSLTQVKSMNSQRYSFKIEFDHNENTTTLDGLDKLCLNNLIQDNTMMKDYIVYRMMNGFGVDSPLCSFAYITVNGEDWGLYLAVEGVEDSFLSRNYGSNFGELYKPDSMNLGGGRGNGKNFNMDNLNNQNKQNNPETNTAQQPENNQQAPDDNGQQGGIPQAPDDNGQQGGMPQAPDGNGQQDENQNGKHRKGGMGADDVKLKYIDDNASSYSIIFDNAKTAISNFDKKRLITSLKNLSTYSDLENSLVTEEVLRYFVVHNFVCNDDSYTGNIIHNYYLHEKNGKLSMIPWDYNLAFGTFHGNDASSAINASIDNPVSGGTVDDRPMLGWIFSNETYTTQYHNLFSELIENWFTNEKLENLISDTSNLIRPYVEKDPTKFCTSEEFEKGVSTLSDFVSLRSKAVENQLNGNTDAIETGDLNLSDMGTMGKGQNGMPNNGNMGISSIINITNKSGDSVELSSLVSDVSSITNIKLSDGTTIDPQKTDMQTLMQTDFTKIVSVSDKEGNIIDLSEYTISLKTNKMQRNNNPFGNTPDTPNAPNTPNSSDSSDSPDSPDKNNPRSPEQGSPAQESESPAQGSNNKPNDNSNGQPSPPDRENQSNGKIQQQNGNEGFNGKDNFTPNNNSMSDNQNNPNDVVVLVMIGASVIILLTGLVIALKKK